MFRELFGSSFCRVECSVSNYYFDFRTRALRSDKKLGRYILLVMIGNSLVNNSLLC